VPAGSAAQQPIGAAVGVRLARQRRRLLGCDAASALSAQPGERFAPLVARAPHSSSEQAPGQAAFPTRTIPRSSRPGWPPEGTQFELSDR